VSNVTLVTTPEYGILRSVPAGLQLLGQGEPARDVYIVHRGVMKLLWADSDGRETIVGLRWPGSFVGAPSVIAGGCSPASVITLVPAAVEQIPGDRFLQILRSDTTLAMRVHEAQSSEIIQQMSDLGELAIASAKTRFLNLLTRLTCSASQDICLPDGRLRLPLKKKELAALLAITPEHLSRMLGELRSEGVIGLSGQWIIVRDFATSSERSRNVVRLPYES
jgi:CRP-like cAMP-binding protein